MSKNGWYIFQSSNYESTEHEITAIEELLKSDIHSKLSLAAKEHLRYTDYSNMEDVQNLMQLSTSVIANNFGLSVELGPIRRLSTGLEKEIQQSLEDKTKERILAQKTLDSDHVKKLTEHLIALTAQIHEKELDGGEMEYEEELEDLRNSRDRILNELAKFETETFKNQLPEKQKPKGSVFGLIGKGEPSNAEPEPGDGESVNTEQE